MEQVWTIEQPLVHLLDLAQYLADNVRRRWVDRLHLTYSQPKLSDFVGDGAEKMTQLFASTIETTE